MALGLRWWQYFLIYLGSQPPKGAVESHIHNARWSVATIRSPNSAAQHRGQQGGGVILQPVRMRAHNGPNNFHLTHCLLHCGPAQILIKIFCSELQKFRLSCKITNFRTHFPFFCRHFLLIVSKPRPFQLAYFLTDALHKRFSHKRNIKQ